MKKLFQVTLIALGLFSSVKTEAQAISPQFFGVNAWMPYAIGTNVLNGKLDQEWNTIQGSKATIIRYGGITVDRTPTTNAQYIKLIDSARAHGMEPIIQVPFNNYQYTSAQAAAVVQYINVTMGKNIKYWMIGNEPNLGYSFTSASQIANYHKPFASAMKNVDPSILIIGPEIAWFDQSIIDGLTSPGGANDITGKDAAGRYYVDAISFHTYPFNGTQTRSQLISKLTAPGSLQDDLVHLNARISACNSYHNRTGTSALMTGITEANVNYKNSTTDNLNGVGANSFIGGQFVAEMMCIGMKNGLDFFNLWSVIEGNSTEMNIGYLDRTTRAKKPLYYHYQLLAENFKGNFANGTTNQTNVKAFGSKDGSQVSVLVMNQDLVANHNYTVRLNTSAVSGSNPLKININAGIGAEYNDVLPNQSTVLLTFNLSGDLIQKTVYSLSGQAVANLPPVTTMPSIAGVCNVPAGLNASLVTGSAATLNWTSTGAASYNVRYKTSASAFWTTLTSTTSTKAISGLTAGTAYDFQVASVCSATAISAFSATSVFTTSSLVCNVPAGLNATLITASTATLNWTASGAASYNVRYKPTGTSTWITSGVSALSQSITGLTASTAYEFQVSSVCSATSSSAYSASITFTTASAICNVPAGLSTSSIAATTATLNWTSTGAASYNVRYKASTSGVWITSNVSVLTKAISGLTAGTAYEFQVASVCSSTLISAFSASKAFTTSAALCNVPAGLSTSSITTTTATLNWATTGAASYNVRYKTSASAYWTTLTSTSLTKAISGLTAGTVYDFQVASVCSATSSSAYSASITFTTASATCSVPAGLSTSSITAAAATLNWTSTGAASYNVRYKASTSGVWITSNVSVLTKAISGLTA
nr:fibronectin type III domain-containing protein [Bacteroidota bacterium]